MFGIGFFELCIIVGVALVCVGPQRLPELMRQMGKFFVQVRRMSSDVKSTVEQVIQDAEDELRREEHKKIEVAITQQMNQGNGQNHSHHQNPVLNVTPTAGEGSHPHHPEHTPPGSAPSPHNPAAAAAVAASSSLGLEQASFPPAAAQPTPTPAPSDERSAFDRIDQLAEAPASSPVSDKAAVKKTPSPDGSQSS